MLIMLYMYQKLLALHTGDKACVYDTCHKDFPRNYNPKNQPLSQPHKE